MAEPLRLAATDGHTVRQGVGQPQSFEAFFEAQSGTLFRRMCLITGNRQEAEEVMQDAFISIFERWERVGAMDDPVGYLYRTAFHLIHKRTRRAARALKRRLEPDPAADAFDAADDRHMIRQALAQLSTRQRMAIILTELLGYSSEEAGKIMRTRPVTVRVLASQGRVAMRQSLRETHE